MSENSTESGFVPPYIAFKTVLTLIERMEREEPPNRIDKSYLDNLSGGYRTQVLAALHSLGLVGPEGSLSEELKALVQAGESERKKIVGEIVRRHYGPVLALSANATQQQMLDAFAEMSPSVTGDTRRKAIAFFLNACQYAGVTVSRHWKTPRVPPSGRKRDGKPGQAGRASGTDGNVEEEGYETPPPPPRTNTRDLTLRSGGIVTLGLSVDLFSLTGSDREFVFELIDKMSAYENQRALPSGPPVVVPEDQEEQV